MSIYIWHKAAAQSLSRLDQRDADDPAHKWLRQRIVDSVGIIMAE